MLRAQLGEIVPWTSARLPVGPLGLPGLGPSSPLRYYDDLDPITSPWTAMDRYSSPRWDVEPYSSAGCDCGLCYGIQAIPGLPNILSDLSYHDPYHHAQIAALFNAMHSQYLIGSEPYGMSREMERFSKELQRACRRNWYCGRGIGDIASQLKYLGRDVLFGSPRRRSPRYGYGVGLGVGVGRREWGWGDHDGLSPYGRGWGGRRW